MIPLPEDAVHLWAVDLARTADEQSALAGTLSARELRRAANMRMEGPRRRFICTRGALRFLLARYLGPPPEELELVAGPHGKPSLAAPDVRFNVAHSGELGLIAVTARAEVGVDIEYMRPRRDPLGVARRYFTPAEYDVIEGAPEPIRAELFYRTWVAKEAFLKATGRGLSASLGSFAVQLQPGPACLLHVAGDEREARRWSLELLKVGAGYAAALVTEGSLTAPPVRRFDPLRERIESDACPG